MSTEKEQQAIIELVKSLFKKIFGLDFGNGNGIQPEKSGDLSNKLGDLSNIIDEELETARENDDFIKLLMLERQKCCVDGIKETLDKVANGEIAPKNEGQIHKIAGDLTEQKIQALMETEEFSDGIEDYHNHDPIDVAEKSKEVNSMIANTNRALNFGQLGNTLNTIMRTENSHASEFLKQPPESHAQEIGQEPSNEQKLNFRELVLENQASANEDNFDAENDIGTGYST